MIHPARGPALISLFAASLLAACPQPQGEHPDEATGTAEGSPPEATPTAGPGEASATPTAQGGATPTATAGAPTPEPTPLPSYAATVRLTGGGVAHITAGTLGDAAFGHGWAFARAHGCILADQILKVRSERSRYLGPGEGDHNLDFDYGMLHLGVYANAEAAWDRQPEDVKAVIAGYAAGYNHWLRETDPADYPGFCAGQPWVKPITPVDLFASYAALALMASGQAIIPGLARAQPPGSPLPSPLVPTAALRLADAGIGSNGWALGSERTASGRGMLAANPHFPWEGELRFFEVHMRVPGVLDAYGGALMGSAIPNIGFNKGVAWTHTFSWAARGTFYRLQLDPRDPTRYRYDGKWRDMDARTYTISVKRESGQVEDESRTLYRTHWGPMVSTEELGWTPVSGLTFRDVNEGNVKLFEHFMRMAMAEDMDTFQAVHEDIHAIPWVHTMAVDAAGHAVYVDSSRVPRLSQGTVDRWQAQLDAGDPLTTLAWQLGAPLLDGTTSDDEWVTTRGDYTIPYASAPYLERADFVFNSNDSHWLANPASPLEGFSPLYGPERTPRSPRTRMNLTALTEVGEGAGSGADGRFDLGELTATLLSNRPKLAELLRDDVAARCAGVKTVPWQGQAVDIQAACGALTAWDGLLNLDSRGALVWRELVSSFSEAEREDAGRLFANPFDPDDPIATPWGLYTPANPREGDPILQGLAAATLNLGAAGFPVDAALGDAQYTLKGETRIPVHGGIAAEGPTNMVYMDTSPITNTSLEPPLMPGDMINDASGLSTEGYLVNYGSSFILALEFAEAGPRGKAILTYSQSSDPASPNYQDQGPMFAEKRWRDVRFSEAEIDGDPEKVSFDISQ